MISVIIPAYNRECYLKRCVESVLSEKEADEIILVDDGSVDSTFQICKDFKRYDSRIIVYHQDNQGPLAARAIGLQLSHGDKIVFIDSDDSIGLGYLKSLNYTLEQNDANLVFSRIAVHFPSVILEKLFVDFLTYFPNKNLVMLSEEPEYLPKLNVSYISSMWNRKYLELYDYQFSANEDLATTAYLYVKADKIAFSRNAIYHCYQSNNSTAYHFLNEHMNYQSLNRVLLPLEKLYQNFQNEKLDIQYKEELEAIFIKNIFQRLRIIDSKKELSLERKQCLENYVMAYLKQYFPSWETNPYFLNCFRGFSLCDQFDYRSGVRVMKKLRK